MTSPVTGPVTGLTRLLVAAAALLLSVAGGAQALESAQAPTAGAAGIGDPYFPADGNGGYRVGHYDVHVRYGFAKKSIAGWTVVTARATRDLSRFNLDLVLDVDSVRVNGKPAGFTRPNAHELQIRPSAPLARGEKFTVWVGYHGRPTARQWGGELPFFADGVEAVAMNEPHIAPWWFPANDHPRDKATFDLFVNVPRGKDVIANGFLAGRSSRDGRTTFHWKATAPMATYLAFFAAGDFVVRTGASNGLPWTIAVSEQLTGEQREHALALMQTTPGVVTWLEGQLGDYPFGSTGGVTTGIDGVYFALENQTRPTYPYVGGPAAISLVVHEQAHQWFGDHIAVQRWRDIWLNEGFATFMEWRYAETHGGKGAQQKLLDEWAAHGPDSTFWDLTIGAPGRSRLFDWAVYDRGAMTVQALRHRIGEADFWELIHAWIERRGGGNGAIGQFRALAESVSGEQLDGFFQVWLYSTDRPEKTAANGF